MNTLSQTRLRPLSLAKALMAACAVLAGIASTHADITGTFEILLWNVEGERIFDYDYRDMDMNDRGDIAGVVGVPSLGPDTETIFILTAEGEYTELFEVGKYQYLKYVMINNTGQIAFNAITETGSNPHVYENGEVRVIEGVSPEGFDFIADINDRGQMVGKYLDGGFTGAWFYDPKTGMHDAGYLDPAGYYRVLRSVNNHGYAVGSEDHDGVERGPSVISYTLEDGMVDLGNFGAFTAGAISVNNRGDMLIGRSRSPVVVFADDGRQVRIRIPSQREKPWVREINNFGHVTGGYMDWYYGHERPYFWSEETGFIDLFEFVPDEYEDVLLNRILQINDRDQILGKGQDDNGGFIWRIDLDGVPSGRTPAVVPGG